MNLECITLCSVDGVAPEKCLRILRHCRKTIQFGCTILFTYQKPNNWTEEDEKSNIELIIVPKFDYYSYNSFIISGLVNCIDTDYVLVVQPDGFIANPHNWKDEFLTYDYIGAPFDSRVNEDYKIGNEVGNGGFSLRSRKFLEIVAKNVDDYDITKHNGLNKNEDFFLCKTKGDFLRALGIKFAPPDVAVQFSLEGKYKEYKDLTNSFGFHGFHDYSNELIDKVINNE